MRKRPGLDLELTCAEDSCLQGMMMGAQSPSDADGGAGSPTDPNHHVPTYQLVPDFAELHAQLGLPPPKNDFRKLIK